MSMKCWLLILTLFFTEMSTPSHQPPTLYNIALAVLCQLRLTKDFLLSLPWAVRDKLMEVHYARGYGRTITPVEEGVILLLVVGLLVSLVVFGVWFCMFLIDQFLRTVGHGRV